MDMDTVMEVEDMDMDIVTAVSPVAMLMDIIIWLTKKVILHEMLHLSQVQALNQMKKVRAKAKLKLRRNLICEEYFYTFWPMHLDRLLFVLLPVFICLPISLIKNTLTQHLVFSWSSS